MAAANESTRILDYIGGHVGLLHVSEVKAAWVLVGLRPIAYFCAAADLNPSWVCHPWMGGLEHRCCLSARSVPNPCGHDNLKSRLGHYMVAQAGSECVCVVRGRGHNRRQLACNCMRSCAGC